MAIDPQSRRNIDDTSAYIRDTLVSVSAQIGSAIRDAVEDAFEGPDASVIKSVGNDLTRSFKSAAKLSDDLASNTYKINRGLIGSRDIQKQIEQLVERRSNLERRIEDSIRAGVEINERDRLAAEKALNVQAQRLKREQKIATIIEKRIGGLGAVFERLSKNKFLGSIVNADEALQAMRATAGKTKNSFAILGSGISAAFKGIEKASVVLFTINSIVKAARFLIGLFISADETTTQIGKNLGVSKDNAEIIRKGFIEISKNSDNILATSKALAEAQADLAKFSGATTLQSFKQADAQVLLTKNLQLSGESAAMLLANLEVTGGTLTELTNKTKDITDETLRNNGYFISNQDVIKEIANTSAEIAGYYAFNVDNLAKAVYQTRRFGLTLQNAKNISEGLLNFEESISSELELELLSGRQFNLERARSLALTGDLAGATQEVMAEMSKLTAEQRQNPILMRSFAQLTGLSAEELNKAYLIQNNLNASTREYIRQLNASGRAKDANLAAELGLQGITEDQIRNNISAQEKFNAALERAKDQFTGFVDSGLLDDLATLLTDFVTRASKIGIFRAMISGPGSTVKVQQEAKASLGSSAQFEQSYKINQTAAVSALEEVIDKRRRLGDINEETIAKLSSLYGQQAIEKALTGLETRLSKSKNVVDVAASKKYSGLKESTLNVEDFTIKTYPKDTLVMAGGTQLGESKETNTLLKELISAVKEGRIINLDGRRVNEGLSLATSKFDRR
jgi:hypothetical protein